jgi:hypothetical protein
MNPQQFHFNIVSFINPILLIESYEKNYINFFHFESLVNLNGKIPNFQILCYIFTTMLQNFDCILFYITIEHLL